MRVITRFGFGETASEVRKRDSEAAEVKLDQLFLNQPSLVLSQADEIFLWTSWATIHVLSLDGRGFYSNIRFHPGREEARHQLQGPTPPNETVFFLDLETGEAALNHELGLLAQDFISLQPWLDRWGVEQTDLFEEFEEAVREFGKRRDMMAGSTGICCAALFDVRRQPEARLLWFYVLTEVNLRGPVFEKKFV